MAKKKAAAKKATTGQFPGMEDNVPEVVQNAVDARDKAMQAKNKATAKFNSADADALALMIEHDVKRVRFRNGTKALVMTDTHKLTIQKLEKKDVGGGDETVFDKD